MPGDDHVPKPANARARAASIGSGVLGRLQTKRIWLALGFFAGGVSWFSNFVDFPSVTRWMAWAALSVIAVCVFAGVYLDSWRIFLAITVGWTAFAFFVAMSLPDLSDEPQAQATSVEGNMPSRPKPGPPWPITAPVANSPQAMVFGFGRWWVLHRDGKVLGLDGQGQQRFAFEVPGPATGIAVCDGALLIVYGHGWIGRFSPQTGKRLAHYHFGSRSDSVICGGDSAWVDKPEARSVVRMDANTLKLDEELPIGEQLSAIAYGDNVVWAIGAETSTLRGIDADTRQLIGPFPVMDDAVLLNFAGGQLWIVHDAQSCLMRFDLARRREIGPGIPLGQLPRAMAARDGILYIVDYIDGSLRQVDAESGEVVVPPAVLGLGLRLVGVDGRAGRVVAIDQASDAAVVLQPQALRAMAGASKPRTRRSRSCPALAG
jgi:hypothetical protein